MTWLSLFLAALPLLALTTILVMVWLRESQGKERMIPLCSTVLVLGVWAIGAWLVVYGHPGFGLLIIAIAACYQLTKGEDKP